MDDYGGSSSPPGGIIDSFISREEALKRFEQINWNDYTRSGEFGITQSDVDRFKKAEAIMQRGDYKELEEFLTADGTEFCQSLVLVLTNVTEPTVVRYALARIEELLPDGTSLRQRVGFFLTPFHATVDSAPFLRLIRAGHGYTESAASAILAKLITAKPVAQDMEALVEWINQCLTLGPAAELLKEPTMFASASAALGSLMILLREASARVIFTHAGGLPLLSQLLRHSSNLPQVSYEVSFCLWTLTYCEDAVTAFGKSGAVAALIQKLMSVPREKVSRVILSALRNLQTVDTYNEAMIEAGLLKTLERMKDHKWSDVDVKVELLAVQEVLLREFKTLTTMERYDKELQTGTLAWGLLHTDKFWQENFMAFETKEFDAIKRLIELLKVSDDPVTVAVALYDLGDFVRFYPNGKMILKRLGAKNLVLRLMTDENVEVRKQALQCMSKIMVKKWEFVK